METPPFEQTHHLHLSEGIFRFLSNYYYFFNLVSDLFQIYYKLSRLIINLYFAPIINFSKKDKETDISLSKHVFTIFSVTSTTQIQQKHLFRPIKYQKTVIFCLKKYFFPRFNFRESHFSHISRKINFREFQC